MRTEDGYIVQRCLNGEPEAFGLLVDKYKASIYAFVYTKIRNFHDAQDITQEVFIKAYTDLRKLRRWDSFLAWLYCIAADKCRKFFRSESKRPDRELLDKQDLEKLDETLPQSHHEEMLYDSLNEVLDSLPETYREVLTLYYLGGKNSQEIARFLGISPTAARQRLSRARTQLKEEVIAMISTTYPQHRLQASFTFRIVEAVKRVKIHQVPNTKGIPIGLSITAGIILTILGISSNFTMPEYVGTLVNSPLPSETRVLKTGEIPVDVVKIFKTPIISSQQDKGKGGEKLPDPKNNIFLAPQGEGNTWIKKADMLTARDNLSTSVVDGRIYAIGGRDSNDVVTGILEEYDPVKDTWVRKADMPTARWGLSTSTVDGKIYAIGGSTRNFLSLSTVEVYDPKTDTWMQVSDMPTIRWGLTTSVVNGKIYAIGGANGLGPCLSTVEEYDPVRDTWAKKADMPTGRFCVSTGVVNGEIYAIGGDINVQARDAVPTVEVYNPATDKWTKKADMPTTRYRACACLVNGKIYIIGGMLDNGDATIALSTVEIYDPTTDKWMKKTDIPTARGFLSADEVGGKIYAIGGYSQVDIVSTVEEYTPEGWPFSILPKSKLPTKWGMEKGR